MALHRVSSALSFSASGSVARCAGQSKREGVILVRALHNKEENKGCETRCPRGPLFKCFSFSSWL